MPQIDLNQFTDQELKDYLEHGLIPLRFRYRDPDPDESRSESRSPAAPPGAYIIPRKYVIGTIIGFSAMVTLVWPTLLFGLMVGAGLTIYLFSQQTIKELPHAKDRATKDRR